MAAESNAKIPFQMHPRVFSALGDGLITNDVVAVIELVKNSYDAFATVVNIRFKKTESGEEVLEIEDDGVGMSLPVLKEAWCTVATPYKVAHTVAHAGKKRRRVVGEKGLGRLSAARLGGNMIMWTKAAGEPRWRVSVDWDAIATKSNLSGCYAEYRRSKRDIPGTGTKIQIQKLRTTWVAENISELRDNLARLLSPFETSDDFEIRLHSPGNENPDQIKIEPPAFLNKPKYLVAGTVENSGDWSAHYRYSPIIADAGSPARSRKISMVWAQIVDEAKKRDVQLHSKKPSCGPFQFEIRAWDIGTDDTREIADAFGFQRARVRKAIRSHKGISVYRDGVLVLPKSDNARDWLGLDLRRVSKVGTRMSTSQIVGYVSISADENGEIGDTSDRERLVSNTAVKEFQEILKAIVGRLENERDTDRLRPDRTRPMKELFDGLDAHELVSTIEELSDEGADASDALKSVRDFAVSLDSAKQAIQERFVYYSRLATVGTISEVLVHEIRNRTTAMGSFLDFASGRFGPFNDKDAAREYRLAYDSVTALERLADTFAPLASRGFRRRVLDTVIEDRIRACLVLSEADIRRKQIECEIPATTTRVAVDPGELDSVLLNLVSNAIYWLSQNQSTSRELVFDVQKRKDDGRIQVGVHDNGPGVNKEDVDKIFLPGVTKKPGGMGMGLTVASELVAEYGGRMSTHCPGLKKGASFAFDLPAKG